VLRLSRTWTETRYVLRFIWTHPGNRSRRFRKLAEAVRFQVRGRVLGKPSRARLGDRSWIWAHLHVYNSSKVVYANPPDWPEMLVWQRVLGPDDLFIDVGANIGIYTILAAERGAEVIAVEPNAQALARLRANLALNGYRAELVQAALSREPGRMRVTRHLDMGNHLLVDSSAADEGGRSRCAPLTS